MKPPRVCLSKSEIPLLLSGDLPPDEGAAAESHIAECESCRSTIESMIADSRWWDDARKSLVASATRSPLQVEVNHDTEPTTTAKLLDLLGPTDDPNMLGRIGPYEIIGLLGQGGMGAVFKGFDRSLNRFVAIKMLLPHLAASGAARKRFAREGQAVAAVVDDHVMAIHCVDEWQGVPYLVMTYSRGVSLQKRLSDNGPLEVREILRIGMQAAKGLAAAHAQGIVHRDIKPANIFLDQSVERVQLMDFGLARAVDDASLTRSGTLAGTPQYMSPEQARAETVDHRSDLFSLGSVLYAACTGHAPFRAESSYGVLRLITDKEPRPIREINTDVPEWLCAIIGKLMAKQAGERFDSAKEVAEILEDCLAHVQQPATAQLPQSVVSLVPTLSERGLPEKARVPSMVKWIASAMFSFLLFFAGVLIVLEWNKGTLTIESDVDDIPIRIRQGDEVVERLTISNSPQSLRIVAGNYVVEVDGDFPDVAIKNGAVSLNRGGGAKVEVSGQAVHANLILASDFRPLPLGWLPFGEKRNDDSGQHPQFWGGPGTVSPEFSSFPTLDNGIEEVALIVKVYSPGSPVDVTGEPQKVHQTDYLVRASGISRILSLTFESRPARAMDSDAYFNDADKSFSVGYYGLRLDPEQKSKVQIKLPSSSAQVCIVGVVGRPNEVVQKILSSPATTDTWPFECWLPARFATQTIWPSRLMRLDGWECIQSHYPHFVQQSLVLQANETGVVKIEPAINISKPTVPQQPSNSQERRPRQANAQVLHADGINHETLAEMQRSFEPAHFVPQQPELNTSQTELEGDWGLEAYISSDGTALQLESADAPKLNICGNKIGFDHSQDYSWPIAIDTQQKTVAFKTSRQKTPSTYNYEIENKKLTLRTENQSLLHYGRVTSRGLTGNGLNGAGQPTELEGDWHLQVVQYPEKLTSPDYVQNLTIRGDQYTSSFPAIKDSSTCPFELDTVAKRIKLLSEIGYSTQQYELIGDQLAIGCDQDPFKLIFARGHAPLGNDAAKSSQETELDGDWVLEAYINSDGTALKLAWADAPYLRIRGNEIDYDKGRNPSRIEFDAQNKTLTYQKDSEKTPSTYRFERKGKQLTLRNENNCVLHYSRNSTAHIEDKTPTELEGPWYLESVAGKPNAFVAETRTFRGNRCELRSSDGQQIRQGEVDAFEKWMLTYSKDAGGPKFETNETYELAGQKLTFVDQHSQCVYRYLKGFKPAPNAPTELEGDWHLESLQVIDGTKVEFKAENRVIRGNRLSCFFADRNSNHRIEVDAIEKQTKLFVEDESAYISERYELNGDKLTIYNYGGVYVSVYAKGQAPLSKGLDALPQERSALWRSGIVDLVFHSDGTSLLGNGVAVSADGMMLTHLNPDWDGDPNFERTKIVAHFDDGSEVPYKLISNDATGLTILKPLEPMQVNHFFKIATSKYRVGDSAWMCFRAEEHDTSTFFDRAKVVMTDRKIAKRPSPVWQMECQQEKRGLSGGMPLLTHDGELLAITLPHKRDIITAIPADQFKAFLEKSESLIQSSSPKENNSSPNTRNWSGIVPIYAGEVNEQSRVGLGMIISSKNDIIAYLPKERDLASKSILVEIEGERIELELGEPSTRTTGNGMYCFRPKHPRTASKHLKVQSESDLDSRDALFIGEAFMPVTLKAGGNRFDKGSYVPSDLGVVNEHFTHMWRVVVHPRTNDETATIQKLESVPIGTPIYNSTGRLLAITISEETEILAVPVAELKIIFPQTLKE